MLNADGVAELLADSRARFLAVTREFAATAAAAAAGRLSWPRAGRCGTAAGPVPVHLLGGLAAGPPDGAVYPTTADSPAFWLYTSGTTGQPKAAMHRHGSIPWSARPTARRCSGSAADDRCLSAAKAFFAYGLGNSVLFPLSAGASTVLEPEPSRPD